MLIHIIVFNFRRWTYERPLLSAVSRLTLNVAITHKVESPQWFSNVGENKQSLIAIVMLSSGIYGILSGFVIIYKIKAYFLKNFIIGHWLVIMKTPLAYNQRNCGYSWFVRKFYSRYSENVEDSMKKLDLTSKHDILLMLKFIIKNKAFC